ncbi:MAG: 1-acyl-sn-glycerol-3-phosphate acyltransferase [Bacteroidetes bacterium]|nr:1-acyl-sn-glycerol-3-phosphate acyltransferase [Bacteroidota bacterium]
MITLLTKPFRMLYALWFYVVFIGSFLLLYPAFAVLLARPRGYRAANRLRRFWAQLVFIGMGIPWRVQGREHLDNTKTYVFCPNHASNLDIPLFALTWLGHYRFMAKKEWADVPVFGIFFRTVDIPVDRQSSTGAYRAFLQGQEALENGNSLVVFPEGTMNAQGPLTRPFKNGPFRMAIRTGVPIVPITFVDNWRLFSRMGARGARPGFARVIVHPPVLVEGLSEADAGALRDQVRGIIEAPLRAHYQVSKSPTMNDPISA